MVIRLKLETFAVHLHETLDQVKACDSDGIFVQPVTVKQVVTCAFLWSVQVIGLKMICTSSIISFL